MATGFQLCHNNYQRFLLSGLEILIRWWWGGSLVRRWWFMAYLFSLFLVGLLFFGVFIWSFTPPCVIIRLFISFNTRRRCRRPTVVASEKIVSSSNKLTTAGEIHSRFTERYHPSQSTRYPTERKLKSKHFLRIPVP